MMRKAFASTQFSFAMCKSRFFYQDFFVKWFWQFAQHNAKCAYHRRIYEIIFPLVGAGG